MHTRTFLRSAGLTEYETLNAQNYYTRLSSPYSPDDQSICQIFVFKKLNRNYIIFIFYYFYYFILHTC